MAETTFRVPFGPQHPLLKEPAKFDFDINGEEIVGARMNIGYNHRGIEKACEARNYYQCIYLLERICGICSHSHTTAFIQAVEELMHLEIPKRGSYLRTLVCELERLHSL
jgi:membrane-bound hydrogenase subunit alpha